MDLNKNIKPLLAIIAVTFSFLYFFTCLILSVKPDPQILIAVVATSTAAIGYYFGSSSGSSKKDETISDSLNKPVVTNADTVNVK